MKAPWEQGSYGNRVVFTGVETLTLIAIGSAVASTAVGALGAMQQASAQKRASAYNAAINTRNAEIARQQAQQDAELQGRQARQRIGAARAAFGASGVDVGEGSPLDVLESSAANAELDKQTILYKGELRAMGYQDTAGLDIMQGENAMTAGAFSAAGTILSGAGRAASYGGALGGGTKTPSIAGMVPEDI